MITLNYEINEEELANSINEAIKLEDNEKMFDQLCQVKRAKLEIEDALEKLEKIDIVAKGLINSKATQLYGNDWQTIASKSYKITRSATGNIYVINPDIKVNKKFLKIVESLNTKAIDEELEKTQKLPNGIELNPSRGSSIRITLK
jgi:hypothetical protein